MAPFAHLHVHSCFSFHDGADDPAALVARATELGYSALALTDTNGLYGAVPFCKAAKAAGIAPLLGAEIDGGDHGGPRAVVLARGRAGYPALCRIVTQRHLAWAEARPGNGPRRHDGWPDLMDVAAEAGPRRPRGEPGVARRARPAAAPRHALRRTGLRRRRAVSFPLRQSARRLPRARAAVCRDERGALRRARRVRDAPRAARDRRTAPSGRRRRAPTPRTF
jgi:error-prone DNA polymerase